MRWRSKDNEGSRLRRARRLARKGYGLCLQGRFEEAIVPLERAIDLWPTYLDARVNLGSVYYQLAMTRSGAGVEGWLAEAIRQYRFVLGIQPDHVVAAINLGAAHHAKGEDAEALAVLEPLARSHPQQRDVHYNLAVVYLRSGDNPRALEAAAAELRNYPDHIEARILRDQLTGQ